MDESHLYTACAPQIYTDINEAKQTFWIAREAHRLATAAISEQELESGDLVGVPFNVCVDVDYVRYHEEGYAKIKSTLNTSLVSTCTGTRLRLEHKIDPIVAFLHKDNLRLYRVVGQVPYRVK